MMSLMNPMRAITVGVLMTMPLACASSQEKIDEQEFARQMAARKMSMRQFQQQPHSNPDYQRSVHEQPVEDPLNAGRDLE